MPLRVRAPHPRTVVRSAALAGCGALVLTGCEAPAPSVTVFTGARSEHTEAVCWNHDNAEVDERTCVPEGGEVPTLRYSASETVGISVDPDVADGGWRPFVATGTGSQEQPLTDGPVDSTYYRFALPELATAQSTVTLRIVAVTGVGAGQKTRGVWLFTLRPA